LISMQSYLRLRDISITVFGYEVKNNVVLYKIEVCKNESKSVIEKRFSTILQELHESIGKFYGIDPPSKRVMESVFGSYNDDLLKSRCL